MKRDLLVILVVIVALVLFIALFVWFDTEAKDALQRERETLYNVSLIEYAHGEEILLLKHENQTLYEKLEVCK